MPTDNITLPRQDVASSAYAVVIAQEPATASDEADIISPEPDSQLEEVSLAQEQMSVVEDYRDSSPIKKHEHQPDSVIKHPDGG